MKAGVSIEQLVESVAQCSLLQSLSVRAVVDTDGQETGLFEVPAGGRRYRALELLISRSVWRRRNLSPCVLRDGGIAEDHDRMSRVTGVNRIELVGFADPLRDQLRACGLCGELLRGSGAPLILAKVLECYPIARIVDRAAA